MSMPQNNAQQDLAIKTVYFYNGTGASVTLNEGEAVAYDLDDTAAPVTTTTLDRKNLRGRRVVTPATAVLTGFAGLVAPQSAGKVVPDATGAYIDIIVPRRGDVCYGYCQISATKQTTFFGITNAGGRKLVAHADATINADLVGVAIQTVDRSVTAGTVLLKFL